ncbi:MAG: TIGR03936 family radical SAM-associated protein, partial [Candidatus Aminicenantes bacterium]|nr:TIGR03936 family radical SAM-associated protein [Candidatus Aminicenantes bacterium]
KKGRFFRPDLEPGTIKKRVCKDIDDSFPDREMIVPLTNVVFDRLTVEIARGCPQNCRFCQAKSYYAPFRSKSLGKIFNYIQGALPATGFEGFSLTSLSSGDYPGLPELLELIPGITNPGVSFSVSSLRPATISGSLLSTISLFRRTGITIVPEAGSERLRKVINKDVSDEEIFKAVDLALMYNWQKMKLYFMIGLPGETLDDIAAIVRLIEEIIRRVKAGKKKIHMHISFSPFVPKPHTPLQWVKQESLAEIQERIRFIKEGLKNYKKLELDFHDPRSSVVETVLARGDSRVGDILLQAYKKGEIFSAWDWDFNFSTWHELIKEAGGEEFLKEIATGEPLPWDFIQVNYKKERLLSEYKNALEMTPMRRCAAAECKACGGCTYGQPEEKPGRHQINPDEYKQPQAAGRVFPGVEKRYNKVRIFYEKKGQFIFFSHLSMMKYLERLIRRSGVDFRCTEGFHPRIKMAALAPLPVYAAGLDEAVELYVDPFFSEELILDALNRGAGDFKFKKVVICNKAPKLTGDIAAVEYEIEIENPRQYKEAIENFLVAADAVSYAQDKLFLKIDFTKQGQERFAKIYKTIDPFKTLTRYLTRTRLEYKSDRGNLNATGS